jgi:hypothetical protein
MTPPIYMHTTGLDAPATTAIERSASAGGHEVRAHVQSRDAEALANALAAVAERADDFRRTFHGHDEAGRPWHVCIEVWP